MPKKYIFIDTNIYVYCALLTKDNLHNSELLQKLLNILEKDKNAILLIPEIVRLEYQRACENMYENKRIYIEQMQRDYEKETAMLTTSDKQKVKSALDDIIGDIKKNKKESDSIFDKILKHKTGTRVILLSPEIMANGYKRAILGKKPYSIKKINKDITLAEPMNADCMIIESLIDYFKDKKIDKGDKLLFCCNDGDFSNGEGKIYDDIKSDFGIQIEYYSSLIKMIENEFGEKIKKSMSESYEKLSKIASSIFIDPDLYKSALNGIISFQSSPGFQSLLNNMSSLQSSSGAQLLLNSVSSMQDSLNKLTSMSNLNISTLLPNPINISSLGAINYPYPIGISKTCSKCGEPYEPAITSMYPDRCSKCQSL